MPLCYGGGIRTLDQAKRVFDLGVEKVCLQSAVMDSPSIVTEISGVFGSQSVVISIDIKRDWFRRPRLYESRCGRTLGRDWRGFLRAAVDAGAGEVVLNAVDRDGVMSGYDLELIRQAAEIVSVPLIALGGAGTFDHFRQAVNSGASAVAAGAMFVFQGPHRAVLISYPPYSELEKLFQERM
jgi:cyclase